ncbi:Protein WVD2-like 7 [Zea mays]|uniref:Protein WVD2-like 7 n=1 Tax=Zea mays TaxID=4577 RepID=A0A3L6EPU4_MAIZE|nr:Protein WVD2-like 7 [Zea mays]
MAADVGLRFNGWSYSDLPYNDHNAQDSSVQEMVLNHGSVSFGRFAAESLSWERRSVFEHNRRQEELSKLTAPGLVAQKKAFFEEYYKRARHLKAQGVLHQAGAAVEENDSSQADELPAAMSEDPVATAPSSSFEPSTDVESKCQDAHEHGYLTFNPLFSQTASLPNIQEESSSSGQKHGFSCETIERKVLAPRRVPSNDNDQSNIAGSRIVLPIASLQSEYLKADPEKSEASKNVPIINRSKKDLATSVISIPRVDLRRNSENGPSRDLEDPFHKRVEMKLRALSDRMDADRTAASSRSASYQPPPERAMTSSRSAYQDRLAISSRSSVCQNTSKALAPSKLAAQASHKFLKGVQRLDGIPREIFVNKGSSASLVASCNSSATGKLSAKILVAPSSSQVGAKTSRTAQVTPKRTAGPTSVNNVSHNKRKHTPVALGEKYPKREYVRRSAPPSARSSSENLPRAAKAPKISKVTNAVSKAEVVQKSKSSSNLVGGRNLSTKRSANCNEENRKAIPSRKVNLAECTRSNLKGGPSLTKNKPR